MRFLKSRRVSVLIVFAICGVVFWGGWEVYAQGSLFTEQWSIDVEWIKNADAILKTLYLIMWPLLAIAWAAMDNSLVYGEAFFLDVTLWKFWQLMRTFTMFGIGFIFVGTILYAFLNPNTAEQQIKKVVIRSLLATILINMSRWMVAAMIDLSTIGVTSIGALPLMVMGDADTIKDIRFMTTHSYYDKVNSGESDANENSYSTIYSCPWSGQPTFFLSCWMDYVEIDGWDNITGMIPRNVWTPNMNDYAVETVSTWWEQWGKIWFTLWTVSIDYCVHEWALVKHLDGAQPQECEERQGLKKQWRDAMRPPSENGPDDTSSWWEFNCHAFSDLTRLAANSSWPLFTLYGSIFGLSNLPSTTNYGNGWEVAIEMMMKVVVWAWLIIPLIAFAVVMVIRVVVLWLVIAFSPILVLGYVYDFKQITEAWEGKFSLQNILGLLFMPVFGVFALSISIIFLSVLNNVDYIQQSLGESPQQENNTCHDDALTALSSNSVRAVKTPDNLPEKWTKCYEFLWIQTICINEGTRVFAWNVSNTMVWLITNGLGIALMWMAVFAVLKSNKFTKETVEWIQNVANGFIKSRKIIPVPWVPGWVSIGGASRALTKLKNEIPRHMIDKQYNEWGMADFVWWVKADLWWVDEKIEGQAKQGADDGTTDWISKPSEEWAKNFNFDKYKWLAGNMGTAIATEIDREMKANPKTHKYQWITPANLTSLKSANSYQDLMSNPAFVRHGLQNNNYFDGFMDSWNGKRDKKTMTRVSHEFYNGLKDQIKEENIISNKWPKETTQWMFHNGYVTRVVQDTDTWVIDYKDKAKWPNSYPFPLIDGKKPSYKDRPQTTADANMLFNTLKKSIGSNKEFTLEMIEKQMWTDYPYRDFMKGIADKITDSNGIVEGVNLWDGSLVKINVTSMSTTWWWRKYQKLIVWWTATPSTSTD